MTIRQISEKFFSKLEVACAIAWLALGANPDTWRYSHNKKRL